MTTARHATAARHADAGNAAAGRCGCGAAKKAAGCPACAERKRRDAPARGTADEAGRRGNGGGRRPAAGRCTDTGRLPATTGPAAGRRANRPNGRAEGAGIGEPIEPALRSRLESRFGQGFADVRVHADGGAARSARALGADAFTHGRDIVFGAGRYRPHSPSGLRLLAHELGHVVQQRAGGGGDRSSSRSGADPQPAGARIDPPGSALEHEAAAAAARVAAGERVRITGAARGPLIQRDLATPPPAVAPPEQAELTDEQIQAAIRFNQQRYDAANTRLIQSLLGGPVTGAWTAENIEAIAATQREYGLTGDGKVGEETFRFLNNEQRLEGMSTGNANCLTAFSVTNFGATPIVRDAASGTCTLSGHFATAAQFSPRCNCAQFEYRQNIRGHLLHNRGGVQVADLGATQFGRLPGGAGLPAAFIEDGDITDVPPSYGHRDQPADANPIDHYIDAAGNDDQANGCRYRSDDFPGFVNVPGIPDCRVGDVIDADMTFRGDIQRNGAIVQSRQWSAIRGRFTVR